MNKYIKYILIGLGLIVFLIFGYCIDNRNMDEIVSKNIELNKETIKWTDIKTKNIVIIPESFKYQKEKYCFDSISDYVFMNYDDMIAIKLSTTIKNINNGAFQDCNKLESVYLPEKLESIGNAVFENCPKLSEIYYKGEVYYTQKDLIKSFEENNVYYGQDILYMTPMCK